MEWVKNIHKSRSGMSGEVFVSLFDTYIKLKFDEDIVMDYVHLCANHLNSLSPETVTKICEYSLLFCRDMMSQLSDVEYPEGLDQIHSAEDILSFITPISLEIDRPDQWHIPAINLYCKCAWDGDNDLQILLINNHVVYVGPFDGLHPWQKNLSEWNNYAVGQH